MTPCGWISVSDFVVVVVVVTCCALAVMIVHGWLRLLD